MIVFFSNTAKDGNSSTYLVGPGNFPFRFEKTTSWQAAAWHDTARVNLCRFQATLFIVNLLNSLWEQTCSPLSNRHSCKEGQWPNRAHCALCIQSWDGKAASSEEHTTASGLPLHLGLIVTSATAPRVVRCLNGYPVKGRKERCFQSPF